jgi:hypothetical protein
MHVRLTTLDTRMPTENLEHIVSMLVSHNPSRETLKYALFIAVDFPKGGQQTTSTKHF